MTDHSIHCCLDFFFLVVNFTTLNTEGERLKLSFKSSPPLLLWILIKLNANLILTVAVHLVCIMVIILVYIWYPVSSQYSPTAWIALHSWSKKINHSSNESSKLCNRICWKKYENNSNWNNSGIKENISVCIETWPKNASKALCFFYYLNCKKSLYSRVKVSFHSW